MATIINNLYNLLLFVTINGKTIVKVNIKPTVPLNTSNTSKIKNPRYIDIKYIILKYLLSSRKIKAATDIVNKIVYIAETKSTLPIVPIKLTLCVPIPSWYRLSGLNSKYCNTHIKLNI